MKIQKISISRLSLLCKEFPHYWHFIVHKEAKEKLKLQNHKLKYFSCFTALKFNVADFTDSKAEKFRNWCWIWSNHKIARRPLVDELWRLFGRMRNWNVYKKSRISFEILKFLFFRNNLDNFEFQLNIALCKQIGLNVRSLSGGL